MKHLSASNVVKEVGTDRYSLNGFSESLTVPKYRDGISYWLVNGFVLSDFTDDNLVLTLQAHLFKEYQSI